MIPKTWFSTPLSKSAKDTEGRIRNIFEGQRRRPAVLVLALATAAALLCGSMVAIRERGADKAAYALRFPEESSESGFPIPNGRDASWGWRDGYLAREKIPALFGLSGELRFENARVDGLSNLTAEGWFDGDGTARKMVVQGWPDLSGDSPIFMIDLYRLDGGLLGNAYPPPEHVEESTVRGVLVRTCRVDTKSKYGEYYCAFFETRGLGVRCMTTVTEQRPEKQARELLERIVSHCLNEDCGVTLDVPNDWTEYDWTEND